VDFRESEQKDFRVNIMEKPNHLTDRTLLLFGRTACENEARLRRLLRTSWRIVALPDESDIASLRDALHTTTAILSLQWKEEWKEAAPQLRLVQALGAGVDAFHLRALPEGCVLCNVYEHAVPIAEYCIGALLALTTSMVRRDRQFRQGSWEGTGRRDGIPHAELSGSMLGLIGYGTIGREIAVRANAFGMKVRAVRSRVSQESDPLLEWAGGPERLRELLETSDHVVVCCPLTDETLGLLNAERLSWMKPTAQLVNVARAEVADEKALYEALKNNRIGGAALDVWYRYPASGFDVLLPSTAPFQELANVIMTPHLSAWTHGLVERRWAKMAANLDALAEGRPLQNVVAGAYR
jgi:phosphoglycerate dehydrogenase-like enzyme